MRKGGEKRGFSPPFSICVLLSMETEEQKKRGRPGNEAIFSLLAVQESGKGKSCLTGWGLRLRLL